MKYCGILLQQTLHGNKREQNTDMHNDVNIKHIILSKEARLKRPHIVLLLLYDILEKKNCIDKKQVMVAKAWVAKLSIKVHEETSWTD